MINLISLPPLPSTLSSFPLTLQCSANSRVLPSSNLLAYLDPTASQGCSQGDFRKSFFLLNPNPFVDSLPWVRGKHITFTGPFALPAPILPSWLPFWDDSSLCHTLLHPSRFLECSLSSVLCLCTCCSLWEWCFPSQNQSQSTLRLSWQVPPGAHRWPSGGSPEPTPQLLPLAPH